MDRSFGGRDGGSETRDTRPDCVRSPVIREAEGFTCREQPAHSLNPAPPRS